MTFAIVYTVKGLDHGPIVLSGLTAQGLADALAYSGRFGEIVDVSITTY